MLVLSRRTAEEIVIDQNIRITVIEVCGGRVRLGIVAPPEIRIDRAEINARRAAGLRPKRAKQGAANT